MELLHLQELCRQPYNRLSGGERQRVMLARVLAQDTPALLLDEPASSLDVGFRYGFYQTLQELCRQGKWPRRMISCTVRGMRCGMSCYSPARYCARDSASG